MGLDKSKLYTTFEVASFSHCVNIEGEPPNFGKLPTPTFSSACDFMMGLGKPQLRAKFEVAGFICYGNIRESVLNDNSLFEPPLGELEIPYGIHL